MKLLHIAALLVSSHRVMGADWDRFKKLWTDTAQSLENEDDRKIMELFTISAIANYGCWCRFNKLRPYKGIPQDTIDGLCKIWYQNYDCMKFDWGPGCNIDVEYNDTLTQLQEPFEMTTDYMVECTARNPNDMCAYTACAVDADFIRGVFNFLADNTLNMTLSGWYGFDGVACTPGWDGTKEANGATTSPFLTTAPPPGPGPTLPAGTTQGAAPQMDCCGTYPLRFPFKLKEGNRACCGSQTYATDLLTCCPGDALGLLGSC